MGGRVYGPYTGRYFASWRETDIEHMVATSEAHDSGLCATGSETKRRFARDLLNLTLASPALGPAREAKTPAGAADALRRWDTNGTSPRVARGRVVGQFETDRLDFENRETRTTSVGNK